MKEFEWFEGFEWFEWFGPSPIEPFNFGINASPVSSSFMLSVDGALTPSYDFGGANFVW